jgi:hypothetical protein
MSTSIITLDPMRENPFCRVGHPTQALPVGLEEPAHPTAT